MSERACELYADHLADLSEAKVSAAVAQSIASCKFFPTIAELREAGGAVVADRDQVPLDVYGETVAECSLALAERRIPRLTAIAAEVVKAMGGAYTLVASDNGPADRARFIEAYNQKLAQDRTIANVVPLARRYVPAPPPRPELPQRPPLALPAHEERPLSAAEAAQLIGEIRKQPRPAKMAPAASSDAARRMPEAPTDKEPAEIVFTTCPVETCGLEYPVSYGHCPRCAIPRGAA